MGPRATIAATAATPSSVGGIARTPTRPRVSDVGGAAMRRSVVEIAAARRAPREVGCAAARLPVVKIAGTTRRTLCGLGYAATHPAVVEIACAGRALCGLGWAAVHPSVVTIIDVTRGALRGLGCAAARRPVRLPGAAARCPAPAVAYRGRPGRRHRIRGTATTWSNVGRIARAATTAPRRQVRAIEAATTARSRLRRAADGPRRTVTTTAARRPVRRVGAATAADLAVGCGRGSTLVRTSALRHGETVASTPPGRGGRLGRIADAVGYPVDGRVDRRPGATHSQVGGIRRRPRRMPVAIVGSLVVRRRPRRAPVLHALERVVAAETVGITRAVRGFRDLRARAVGLVRPDLAVLGIVRGVRLRRGHPSLHGRHVRAGGGRRRRAPHLTHVATHGPVRVVPVLAVITLRHRSTPPHPHAEGPTLTPTPTVAARPP